MNLDALIAAMPEEDRHIIMRLLKERHDFVTAVDYEKDDDDVTSDLYWLIGDALYRAAYPPEPEPEVIPEPLPIPGDGEELYYCRKCGAPRVFALNERRGWFCKTCNTPRVDITITRLLQQAIV